MADPAIGQGPVQQEFGQLAVEVGLVLEHLHQLQQVLEKLVVPAEKGGRLGPGAPRLGRGSAAGKGAGVGREAGLTGAGPEERSPPGA